MNVYVGTDSLKNAYIGEYDFAKYQEVEYIQSSGTQYIDTGYIPKTTTRFDVKYNIVSKSSAYSCLFGASTNASDINQGRYYIGWRNESGKTGGIYIVAPTYNYNSTTVIFGNIGVDYNLTYTGSTLSDGTNTASITYSIAPSVAMYIFADNNGGTASEKSNAKLYNLKLYEGATLVRDFIPCYRKSDNVIGLYDLVNSVFYTNAGTGTFTKGPDVN